MMYIKVSCLENIENFKELAKEHWDSFNNPLPSFDINILKNFKVIQAIKEDKTVGYLLYILFKSPYYEEIWCQVDMFYLAPEYRKQGIGKEMFKRMEEEAKKQGASKILSSFNLKQPLIGFYENLGYTQTHVAVAKEL